MRAIAQFLSPRQRTPSKATAAATAQESAKVCALDKIVEHYDHDELYPRGSKTEVVRPVASELIVPSLIGCKQLIHFARANADDLKSQANSGFLQPMAQRSGSTERVHDIKVEPLTGAPALPEPPSPSASSTRSSFTSPKKRVRFDKGVVSHKTLKWSMTQEIFTLAAAQAAGAPILDLVCVLEGRLYLARHVDVSLSDYFQHGVQTRIVRTNKSFAYRPFCADFGPINLGMTHRFCELIAKLLQETPPHVRVIFCAGETESPEGTTNAVYLLGAFLLIHLGASVDEARPVTE